MNEQLQKAFDIIEKRKSEILKDLEEVDENLLLQPEEQGKWSVVQVIRHLSISENLSLAYCKKKILAGADMPDIGLIERVKLQSTNRFLRTNVKFKMPLQSIAPEEDLQYQEVCMEWYNVRQALYRFIDEYPEAYLGKAVFKHPIAGRVTLEGMLLLFDSHMKHHQFQIDRILKKVAS